MSAKRVFCHAFIWALRAGVVNAVALVYHMFGLPHGQAVNELTLVAFCVTWAIAALAGFVALAVWVEENKDRP